jgi:hypothetical protein
MAGAETGRLATRLLRFANPSSEPIWKSNRYTLSNRYVTIAGLPTFDTVVITSNNNSFEFHNVAAAVPELSTWAMMILGFVGLGYVACRHKSFMPAAANA